MGKRNMGKWSEGEERMKKWTRKEAREAVVACEINREDVYEEREEKTMQDRSEEGGGDYRKVNMKRYEK